MVDHHIGINHSNSSTHTDSNFKVLDKINLTGKLNSYCIPDPEALLVNNIPIENIYLI